ncbi:MAG: thiamine biosynthesis protein [Desulfobacterales bacterium]|nr:thiamine biosynthesis protein [Desulfobacterales bacterium]
MSSSSITALALFSGGLDSLLACRTVMAQGIRVQALKFVTPFFGYDLLAREQEYIQEVKEKYDIDLRLIDVTGPYLELLRAPVHGFGKHFNPCVDCKIFLLSRARRMMDRFKASFLITGEVIGQRPMSQRRDTLFLIQRDSGCKEILVRPLCAKNLPPTRPELEGLINREQLLGFSGRGRSAQMQLAADLGISDYPSPAGGCTLTDPVLGERIKRYYQANDTVRAEDIRLLLVGRQFVLPQGGWLAMGRNQAENQRVDELRRPGDLILNCVDRPGPTGLLRRCGGRDDLDIAAGIMARYAKKGPGLPAGTRVEVETTPPDNIISLTGHAPADAELLAWQR